MKTIRLRILNLSLSCAILVALTSAFGSEIHWTGWAQDNQWTNAANWNPAVVPGSEDSVSIDASGTYAVVVNGLASVQSINLGGSDGVQSLTLSPYSTLTAASVTVASNAVMRLEGGTLVGMAHIDGAIEWLDGAFEGTITIATNATCLILDGGEFKSLHGTLLNEGVAACSANTLFGVSGASGFCNAGTLLLESNCCFSGLAFTNSGTVIVSNSVELSLKNWSCFVQDGAVQIESNAVFSVNLWDQWGPGGTVTLADGAVFAGSGSTRLAGGSFFCDGSITVDPGSTVEVGYNGSLEGSGTFTGDGLLKLVDGIIGMEARLALAPGFKLHIEGQDNSIYGQVTNYGTITCSSYYLFGSSEGFIANKGDFSIESSCTVYANVKNFGTLRCAAPLAVWNLKSGATLEQAGIIVVETNATLTFDMWDQWLFPAGSVTLTDGARFSGPGLVRFTAGPVTCSGTITVDSGSTVEIGSNAGLAGTGTWTGDGVLNFNEGNIYTAASITIAPGFHVNLSSMNSLFGQVVNQGTITLLGEYLFGGMGGSIENQGTFVVQNSSSWNSVSFLNSGTITCPPGGEVSLNLKSGSALSLGGTWLAESNAVFTCNLWDEWSSGGTVTLADGLAFSGDGLTLLTGGNITCDGNVSVQAGSYVELGMNGILGGSGTWTGDGLLTFNQAAIDATAFITLGTNFHVNMLSWNTVFGHLVNEGTITNFGFDLYGGFNCLIENRGLFVLPNGSSWSGIAFTNSGTVLCESGNQVLLNLRSGTALTLGGVCRTESSGELTFNLWDQWAQPGTMTLADGLVFSGPGIAKLAGGVFNCAGTITLEAGSPVLVVGNGILGGTGTWTGDGILTLSEGGIEQNALITIAPGFNLQMQSFDTIGGQLVNNGIINCSANELFGLVGGLIDNRGTFVLHNNCEFSGLTFTNSGTFLRSSSGSEAWLTLRNGAVLDMAGTVYTDSVLAFYLADSWGQPGGAITFRNGAVFSGGGVTRLMGGVFGCDGTITIDQGTVVEASNASFGGTGTWTGNGRLDVDLGGIEVSGSVTLAPDFHLNLLSHGFIGGELINYGTITCSAFGLDGMANNLFDNRGTFILQNPLDLRSIHFVNHGTFLCPSNCYSGVTLSAGASLSLNGICRVETNTVFTIQDASYNESSIVIGDGTSLEGEGTIRLNAGNHMLQGNVTNSTTLISAYCITNDGSGVLHNTGSFILEFVGNLYGSGAINNLPNGVVEAGSFGTTPSIGWNFTNAGTLKLHSGGLIQQGDYIPASGSVLAIAVRDNTYNSGAQLVCSNAFTAAGTLALTLDDGFVPPQPSTFPLISFPAFSGSFSEIQYPTPQEGGAVWAARLTLDMFFLELGFGPVLTNEPQSATVQEGESVAFEVGASSDFPLSYQWMHDGTVISGATQSSLIIQSAQMADAGAYSAIVSNLFGAVTSSNAYLAVIPTTQILQQPLNSAVASNAAAVFGVVAQANGSLNYQWLKNGSPLMDGGKISGAQTPNLTVAAVALADLGQYSVLVTGTSGSILSSNAALQMLPVVKIVSPGAGARNTSELVVTGTASAPGSAVTQVLWQLNGAAFQTAIGTTSWNAKVALVPGTNFFNVKTVNADGNESPVQTRVYFFNVLTPLKLVINGVGTVSGATDGQQLLIGKRYSLKAIAGASQIFSNWSGSVTGDSTTLAFLMQSNLLIEANFVANPFLSRTGIYNGLFYETQAINHDRSGSFSLKLAGAGTFSGKLSLAGLSRSIKGKFNPAGNAQIILTSTPPVTIDLALDVNGQSGITGLVAGENWSAQLSGIRGNFVSAQPTKHTVALAEDVIGANGPGGDGIANVTLKTNGLVSFVGRLSDNTAFSAPATYVSAQGELPLYIPLYGGKGSLLGWLTNDGSSVFTGNVSWIKAVPCGTNFETGFTNEVLLTSSTLSPIPLGTRPLNLTNAMVILSDHSWPCAITNYITLTNSTKLLPVPGQTNGLVLSLSASSGQISGTFTNPVTRLKTPIKAILMQDQNEARGFIQSPASGTFLIKTAQ